MRYKTTIEVVTEAKDRAEAIEIVGEYLSGDILSGVQMKYSTRSISGVRNAAIAVTALSLVLVAGIISMYISRPIGIGAAPSPSMSAVQPILQTQAAHINDAQFKAQWQEEHNKEALRKIKLSR